MFYAVIDSSAKLIDGVVMGTMSSFGDYDECIDTVVHNEKSRLQQKEILFQGKYCTVDFKLPLPPKPPFYKMGSVLDDFLNFSKRETMFGEYAKNAYIFYIVSVRFGICVPSGCSVNDVLKVAQTAGKEIALIPNVTRCEIKQENEFSPVVIGVISAFSFMGLLVLIGTLIDFYVMYRGKIYTLKIVHAALAFSLRRNVKKFLDVKTSKSTLSCLHGIRFFSMSWIILGHTYYVLNFQLFRGWIRVADIGSDFAFLAVINGTVSVDTFFFMSGMLLCYLTTKYFEKSNKKLNVPMYILHRLWRVLPVYTFVIAFIFLNNLFGSGPAWHETVNPFYRACYRSWWRNLLFINNYQPVENMCLPHSWYTACDMQLYIGALIILLPLSRWPKIGLSIAALCILVGTAFSAISTYLHAYPPTSLFSNPDLQQRSEYMRSFYINPLVHTAPYCVGILTGYFLAMKQDIKIPKKVLIVGWSCAFVTNIMVVYGVWRWNKGEDPKIWETLLYASFHRVAWALGIAWMVICCATGYGGIINKILSWKLFIPLGRLTFIAYLIHPLIQLVVTGSMKEAIHLQHHVFVWKYFGHMCITYFISFAGSMLIEAPFMTLEKILMKSDRMKNEKIEDEKFKENLKLNENVPESPKNFIQNNFYKNNEKVFICKL